jgi:hypothetical protein
MQTTETKRCATLPSARPARGPLPPEVWRGKTTAFTLMLRLIELLFHPSVNEEDVKRNEKNESLPSALPTHEIPPLAFSLC